MRFNLHLLALVAAGAFAAAAQAQSTTTDGAAYTAKTRAQVRAEAIEALRLGLVSHGDFTARDATPAELELIRLAGLRAREAESRLAGR